MSFGDKINSFRDGANAWITLLLKVLLIFAAVVGIAWMGLSLYANFQEYNFIEIKSEPSVEKAQYEFRIVTTGEVILSQDFDSVVSGDRQKYILHGYFKVDNDKWKYIKSDLILDENYFGEILWRVRINV